MLKHHYAKRNFVKLWKDIGIKNGRLITFGVICRLHPYLVIFSDFLKLTKIYSYTHLLTQVYIFSLLRVRRLWCTSISSTCRNFFLSTGICWVLCLDKKLSYRNSLNTAAFVQLYRLAGKKASDVRGQRSFLTLHTPVHLIQGHLFVCHLRPLRTFIIIYFTSGHTSQDIWEVTLH